MTGDEVERERGRVEGAELDKKAVRRQEPAPLWQNRTRDASPQIINGSFDKPNSTSSSCTFPSGAH